jgi:hypothetical protein
MVADTPSLATRRNTPLESTFFLQSEIDLAFAFLHLAHFAIVTRREILASELIARAAAGYKMILSRLGSRPTEFENGPELQANARKLFEAIHEAERQRSLKCDCQGIVSNPV